MVYAEATIVSPAIRGHQPNVLMPWIRIIPSEEADPALERAYEIVSQRRGGVANIVGVHSVHPEVMLAHIQLYEEIMFSRSELTRAERETVAVGVSSANDCFY